MDVPGHPAIIEPMFNRPPGLSLVIEEVFMKKIRGLVIVILVLIGVFILAGKHVSRRGVATYPQSLAPQEADTSNAGQSSAIADTPREANANSEHSEIDDMRDLEGLSLNTPENMTLLSNPALHARIRRDIEMLVHESLGGITESCGWRG